MSGLQFPLGGMRSAAAVLDGHARDSRTRFQYLRILCVGLRADWQGPAGERFFELVMNVVEQGRMVSDASDAMAAEIRERLRQAEALESGVYDSVLNRE